MVRPNVTGLLEDLHRLAHGQPPVRAAVCGWMGVCDQSDGGGSTCMAVRVCVCGARARYDCGMRVARARVVWLRTLALVPQPPGVLHADARPYLPYVVPEPAVETLPLESLALNRGAAAGPPLSPAGLAAAARPLSAERARAVAPPPAAGARERPRSGSAAHARRGGGADGEGGGAAAAAAARSLLADRLAAPTRTIAPAPVPATAAAAVSTAAMAVSVGPAAAPAAKAAAANGSAPHTPLPLQPAGAAAAPPRSGAAAAAGAWWAGGGGGSGAAASAAVGPKGGGGSGAPGLRLVPALL